MGTRGPSFHLLLCSVPKAVLHLIAWLLLCQYKGVFLNYVDKILPIIDHIPTPCWHLRRNYFTVVFFGRGNLATLYISITTYSRVPNNSAARLLIFPNFSLPTRLIWTYTLIKFQEKILPTRLLCTYSPTRLLIFPLFYLLLHYHYLPILTLLVHT